MRERAPRSARRRTARTHHPSARSAGPDSYTPRSGQRSSTSRSRARTTRRRPPVAVPSVPTWPRRWSSLTSSNVRSRIIDSGNDFARLDPRHRQRLAVRDPQRHRQLLAGECVVLGHDALVRERGAATSAPRASRHRRRSRRRTPSATTAAFWSDQPGEDEHSGDQWPAFADHLAISRMCGAPARILPSTGTGSSSSDARARAPRRRGRAGATASSAVTRCASTAGASCFTSSGST